MTEIQDEAPVAERGFEMCPHCHQLAWPSHESLKDCINALGWAISQLQAKASDGAAQDES